MARNNVLSSEVGFEPGFRRRAFYLRGGRGEFRAILYSHKSAILCFGDSRISVRKTELWELLSVLSHLANQNFELTDEQRPSNRERVVVVPPQTAPTPTHTIPSDATIRSWWVNATAPNFTEYDIHRGQPEA